MKKPTQQARLGHIDVKMTPDVMSKLHAYLKVGLRSFSNINMTSHKSSLYEIMNNDISSEPILTLLNNQSINLF